MLTYGFYNSVNKDRKYDAEQIGAIFNGLINDGVYANYKEAMKIVPGSGKREIIIRPGRAWFNGTWILVDGDGHSFYIMGSQVETTYYIYLCVSKKDRRNSIAWYSEVQESKPEDGKFFYLMGQVTIPAGANMITEDMIVDLRGSSHCPFVTGILETADFEKIVRETCEENWLLWLNSYEASLDIKMSRIQATVNQAYNVSELALNTTRDLRHIGYTWAKYHAIQVQGGSLAWILAADVNDSGGKPPERILYREFASDGVNITLSNPVSENALTAAEQYRNYRSAPYFNGDGQGGTVAGDVYRYDRMTENVKMTGTSVTVTYGYRVSKVKLVEAVYEPGEYIETVHGEYASEYPLDGYKDGYWYTRFAARASEVVFDDDGLTISARTVQEAIVSLTKLIGSGSTGGTSQVYIEVDSLPDAGISGAIYIVKNPTGGDSDEYIWVDRWEKLGGSSVSGGNVVLDTTLTQSGKAADAKATGDEIKRVEGKIPTKPEDIGAQPKGNYLTEAPVATVNGKTGTVVLGAADVNADPTGTAANAVSGHNVDRYAHNDIRTLVQELIDRTNLVLNSTDEDLDQMAELVAYIKSNKSLIDSITTSKVSVTDIVDNLTTNLTNKPLSAAQGVVIKTLLDGLSSGKLDANKLTEAISTALAQAKADGQFDGKDGVSPTVVVSTITGGHRVSITDENGTKTVDVMDGDPGDPGRGIKSITRTSGNGAAGTNDTYTITYTDDTASTFQVRNGSNGTAGKAATFEITGATVLAYGAAPTVTEQSGSTAQARKYSLGIPAGKPGADAESPILTMYISPDGSDSHDGLTADTPKKTVKACVSAGASRISAKRGVYREGVQLWNIGELEIFPTDNDLEYAVGVEREPIVFEVVDRVEVSSFADYKSIKRVVYSNADNTQFDKVFTRQSQPPVVSDYGSRYNATVWLLSNDEKSVCIKLKPVLTVAECEAETNTFSYVDGYIYINADLTGVEQIVVPNLWETGFYINGAQRLVLREVEVRFSGTYNIDIRNCAYFDFYKCSCKYTAYGSGFHPFNSNGRMDSCYATKNYDGYGISGYGHTEYVDCVSEYNFDDGMSHHNGTTGTVIGGRYEGNGKGGCTPAYGAKVNIYGGLYKDNASFGIGYLWASDLEPANGMVQGAVMVGNPVGLTVNANCNVTAMNCAYQANTTDKEIKGNFSEYSPNYVKTVNGVKPDKDGNVEVEVSGDGGNTGPTNVLPLSINADGTPFVGPNGEKGYKPGYRVSSSGVEKESAVNSCSGFIACKASDEILFKNATPERSGYSVQYFFNASFAKATNDIIADAALQPDENGVYRFTVPANSAIAYVRLTLGAIDETTIVTVNEDIV